MSVTTNRTVEQLIKKAVPSFWKSGKVSNREAAVSVSVEPAQRKRKGNTLFLFEKIAKLFLEALRDALNTKECAKIPRPSVCVAGVDQLQTRDWMRNVSPGDASKEENLWEFVASESSTNLKIDPGISERFWASDDNNEPIALT